MTRNVIKSRKSFVNYADCTAASERLRDLKNVEELIDISRDASLTRV